MNRNSDINLEAKDFKRYYSGEMSGREMYALEKAALADPFLADALEGYKHTVRAVSDIEELQKKIDNRLSEKKETKIISFNKNSFLKVAVLIAFLAGAAYFYLTQNNNKIENNSLASTSPAEIKSAIVDSSLESSQSDLAQQETNQSEINQAPIIALHKNGDTNKREEKGMLMEKNTERSVIADTKTSAGNIAVAPAPVAKSERLNDRYLIQGKVVNEQGEPIPFASIVTNKEQINTDITGNYTAYIKDSSLYGNVAAAGYLTQQKKLNPNLSQTIILNSDIAKTEKISEIERSQSAKKAMVTDKNDVSASEEITIVNNILAPANGWAEYEKYLKDSVRYQAVKRAIVQLSFTVNDKGRPQQIKVIDGLCLPCNNEAIRLLKDGPDWTALKKGKGLLKVQF